MAAPRPLISIGMPVRNARSTLELAVRSIRQQTCRDWELLLIDDGSTDDTARLARRLAESDPRIRVSADGRRLGLPGRLNQAIAEGRGAFFARMDGDDVSYPDRLRRQLGYLDAHPEVDLVGAYAVVFRPDGEAIGRRAGGEHHEAICARPHAGVGIMHPSFFGRLAFFRRFGYRPSAHRCEDQDLLLRAIRRDRTGRGARYANVPEILIGYREGDLVLRKLLASRLYLARSLLVENGKQGRPFSAARGVVEQSLKAAVDAVAIVSGLDYRLLRHRALPMDAAERTGWSRVWSALHAEAPILEAAGRAG